MGWLRWTSRRAWQRISTRKPDTFTDLAWLLTERVTDAATMWEWAHIAGTGFDLPPFVAEAIAEANLSVGLGEESRVRHYLARIDGEPVACSTLALGSEVAGIYNVASLPTHRRRGAGTAATLAALSDARQVGYHVAVLAASAMAHNLYRRLGFADCCTVTQYYAGPAMDEGSSG